MVMLIGSPGFQNDIVGQTTGQMGGLRGQKGRAEGQGQEGWAAMTKGRPPL